MGSTESRIWNVKKVAKQPAGECCPECVQRLCSAYISGVLRYMFVLCCADMMLSRRNRSVVFFLITVMRGMLA